MGYYLQTPETHGKAEYIIKVHGAKRVSQEEAAAAMTDPDVAVVAVKDNGMFEAAGFAYDQREWEAFTLPDDPRPTIFLTMGRALAERETNFPKTPA